MRQIAIVQGHPDRNGGHYGQALATAYTEAATRAGHSVSIISVAELDFPILRTQEEFNSPAVPPAIERAQQTLRSAQHILIVFPLWHGTLPSLLKAFFEQTFRPGFAMEYRTRGLPRRLLKGRSARIIVTMGMPAMLYRWLFGAHGVRVLERSILWWSGISPVRTSYIGSIGELSDQGRRRWLVRAAGWGARGV
jgi:putative NADPH-quinone reductase